MLLNPKLIASRPNLSKFLASVNFCKLPPEQPVKYKAEDVYTELKKANTGAMKETLKFQKRKNAEDKF